MPNEDAQSLIYDDTNLFKVDKFSGCRTAPKAVDAPTPAFEYMRSSTAAGFSTCCSDNPTSCSARTLLAVGDLTGHRPRFGLDTTRADYVARAAYQPNKIYSLISRFRFDGWRRLHLRRLEIEGRANFDRLRCPGALRRIT